MKVDKKGMAQRMKFKLRTVTVSDNWRTGIIVPCIVLLEIIRQSNFAYIKPKEGDNVQYEQDSKW